MADHLKLLIAGMDDSHRAVLQVLTDGEVVYPAETIADSASLPLRETRKILRSLRAMGLARHGPLFNDGLIAGSGTFLTSLGERALRQMEADHG